MHTSAFELFRVGVGPSSSHTVAPMRAGADVARRLADVAVHRIEVTLHGSLALTCRGHGTDRALLAGLAGHEPETVRPEEVLRATEADVAIGTRLLPPGAYVLHLQAEPLKTGHPNAMSFVAQGENGDVALDTTFRSVGGGFITEDGVAVPAVCSVPFAYASGVELIAHAEGLGSLAQVALRNECAHRSAIAVEDGLQAIANAMSQSIDRGLLAEGVLPGGLRVRRRASALHRDLTAAGHGGALAALEWVGLWAIAVNEENAAGGRIVTAPTNGAAGVLPAVLRYGQTFEGLDAPSTVRFLLAAAAVGALIKRNASISGAEVGCQGEVGSAAAMAAAGLVEAMGGTPRQVANAAEIALEHHLGMTCDPIGGLVQVPCIERNAIGAGKAIAAAKLALRGDGQHVVSLDQVIDAMRRTGADMSSAYKETSRGGLAVSVPAC